MSIVRSDRPEVWLSSCRTVMRAARGSAIANPGTCAATGSSSLILPRSTSVMTAMAVNDLLTEATRMGVSSVTGRPSESWP